MTIDSPELVDRIFSFLTYLEVYRMRMVCTAWLRLAEEHIYLRAKNDNDPVIVQSGSFHQRGKQQPPYWTRTPQQHAEHYGELFVEDFDADNHVVELRPLSSETVSLAVDATDVSRPPTAYHRQVQLYFRPWVAAPIQEQQGHAFVSPHPSTPLDLCMMQLHIHYNPALEQVHVLPPWNTTSASLYEELHYVANKGFIMCFSYLHTDQECHQRRELEQIAAGRHQRPFLHEIANAAVLPAPRLRVHWLRVSIAWLVSGFHPDVHVEPLYPAMYARLECALQSQHMLYRYDRWAEPVLRYILDPDDPLPATLLDHVRAVCADEEAYTPRLARLERLLESVGVDHRVIWKYPFLSSFALGFGSSYRIEETIVGQVQEAEREWRNKKRSMRDGALLSAH
ncbi:hypothetical protein BCR43DRAFT_486445 [Syncephalastrum racemosum]|uniref:F-box domain-containing protein n=1 Tax=Syncephalastrum racemosum TaxID=13706 RepID=A0A1X2HP60_SYNRA|nr:hypothetical protein BCR43DRAFT_486445 [Syncephalastrum racemosum]